MTHTGIIKETSPGAFALVEQEQLTFPWFQGEEAKVYEATPPREQVDMKEALTSNRKPDITHVRGAFMTYTARPCEYGSEKYERANYLRPVAQNNPSLAGDFHRYRSYLRAALSHVVAVLDSMEQHESGDPGLNDGPGILKAVYAKDTDVTPGSTVGPSLLPHVAAACASLQMAITQAVNAGLLPADPGTPWRAR